MTLARKLHLTLAAVGFGWLLVLVVWRPAPFAVSFDDAYYYFTIGRNWAHGHASTFDRVDRTNGYHPLWQLVCIIPYLLGLDGTRAVRALLVLQLVLWVAAWHVVTRQVVDAVDGWPRLGERPRARKLCDAVVVVVVVALAANPFLFKMVVNGLESGLVVPVSALLLGWSVTFRGRFVSRASRRQRLVGGGILALAFLSRTDAVLLLAVLAAWCLLDGGTSAKPVPLTTRASRTIELLAIPAVVIAGYLVANLVAFHSALQISGTVKRLPLTPLRGLVTVVWALVGVGVLIGVRKPISTRSKAVRARRFLSATGWYGAFCVALLGYYSTLQAVPYLWYFAPLALYGTWLILLFAVDLAEGSTAEALAKHPERDVSLAGVAPACIVAVPLVAACIWSATSFVDPGARALMVHDARAGTWMSSNLPPDARLAAWDAGVLGYFSDRDVVNLDGVVNSKAWLDALHDGSTARFLAARDVRWVSNHGGDVSGRDPGIDKAIRSYFGKQAAGSITVVYADHFAYSGTLDGSRTDTSTKQMGSYVYRLAP